MKIVIINRPTLALSNVINTMGSCAMVVYCKLKCTVNVNMTNAFYLYIFYLYAIGEK